MADGFFVDGEAGGDILDGGAYGFEQGEFALSRAAWSATGDHFFEFRYFGAIIHPGCHCGFEVARLALHLHP